MSKVSSGNGAQPFNQEKVLLDMVKALPQEDLHNFVKQSCSWLDPGRKESIAIHLLPGISLLKDMEMLECLFCSNHYHRDSGDIYFLACCFQKPGIHFMCKNCITHWAPRHHHPILLETCFAKISHHVFRASARECTHRELDIAGDGMGHEVVQEEQPIAGAGVAAVDLMQPEVAHVEVRPDGAHEIDEPKSDVLRFGAEGEDALKLQALVIEEPESHNEWAHGSYEGLPRATDDSKYIGVHFVKVFDHKIFIGTVVAWAAKGSACPDMWRGVDHDYASMEIFIALSLSH